MMSLPESRLHTEGRPLRLLCNARKNENKKTRVPRERVALSYNHLALLRLEFLGVLFHAVWRCTTA